MRQWGPRLDWEHLKNWVLGVLGVSAAILLVVVAANFPTQINSRPAEVPPPQSAAVPTKGQTDSQSASQPALPPTSPVAGTVAKAKSPSPATPAAPATKTGDVPTPTVAHDHAMVKAEAVVPPAPVQSSEKPDQQQ
jgi:hypothetical protein